MGISAEVWIAAAYGGILLLVALGQYLARPRQTTKNDAVIAGVGMAFGEHDQMERLIAEVKRIGDILSDEKQSDMQETLDALLALMKEKPVPRRR